MRIQSGLTLCDQFIDIANKNIVTILHMKCPRNISGPEKVEKD